LISSDNDYYELFIYVIMGSKITKHQSPRVAQNLYTPCYNCQGTNQGTECGFPMSGCLLCEAYGGGHGNLLKEYRYKLVTIGGQTFTPPTYSCLFCKDTKLYEYEIYVKSLYDDRWSDGGQHNMPRVKVACHSCSEQKHNLEYDQARAKIVKLHEVN
jgi:hypothetical protein